MTLKYLVMLDISGIHDYIFGTNKLREIRGASNLLDHLNRIKAIDKLKSYGDESKDWECIVAGGGNIKVIFAKKDNAEQYEAFLQSIFREEAKGIGITTTLSVKEDLWTEEEWIHHAERQLQRKKLLKQWDGQVLTSGYFKSCQACGLYPAEKQLYDRFICKVCSQKIESSDHISMEIYKRLFKDFDNFSDLPTDFSDISKKSYPRGYIGFIYADGNKMGKHLETMKTFSDLKNFSSSVEEATFEAAENAINKHFEKKYLFKWDEIPGNDDVKLIDYLKDIFKVEWAKTENINKIDKGKTIIVSNQEKIISLKLNDKKTKVNLEIDGFSPHELSVATENNELNIYKNNYNFQIILAGGDDFIMAVPAHKAISVAIDFCEKFNEMLEKEDVNDSITTSVAVVLCHHGMPIKNILESAEKLLKNAKMKGKEDSKTYIDFIATSGSALGDPISRRKKELEYLDSGTISLTMRPYSIEDMHKILNIIEYLKKTDFPKSKLKTLYASLFKGFTQAFIEASYMKIHSDESQSKSIEKIENCFGMGKFPWKIIDTNKYETPFQDIMELYEFIHVEDEV